MSSGRRMTTEALMESFKRGPDPGPSGPFTREKGLGWGGVALGLLAFLITLPPFEVRTVVPSLILALIAIGLGAVAIDGGERRLGVGAIVAALFGAVGAYAASRSGVSHLEVVVSWGALTAAMLRYATPLTFAALGGLVSERAGVVNIALEGMMLMGAFFGAYGADKTDSWVGGIVIGVLAGMALAAIHAVFAISLRSDQIVVGTGLNFLALGLTGYMYVDTYGAEGTPDNLPAVPDVNLPTDSLGFLGQAISQLNLLVWGSLVAVVLVWVVVFRTRLGLRLRSVGENPRAAETVGIVRLQGPLCGGDHLRWSGRAWRRVPVDWLRPLVLAEHDRGARLHRPGGADLRALAARRTARRGPPRLLQRAGTAAAGVLAAAGHALPGAALRADADRRGGRRRRRSTPPAADGVPYTREGK